MPISEQEKVVDGERIYLGETSSTDEERNASADYKGVPNALITNNNRLKQQPKTNYHHLQVTQQILDLLDEKLQTLPLQSEALYIKSSSHIKIPITQSREGSGRLKLSHNYRRRSYQSLRNLDYYLDHVIKEYGECSCHFERSSSQKQINHPCHIGNNWREACCSSSRSESGTAVTLNDTSDSFEAQLACYNHDGRESTSVNSLTSHSREASSNKSHSLIIDGVSCKKVKHCACLNCNVKVKQDTSNNPLTSDRLDYSKLTNNKLASIYSTNQYFHHQATRHYCPSNAVSRKQADTSAICYKSSQERIHELDEENQYSPHSEHEFDLVSEAGSALEELAEFECCPSTCSLVSPWPKQDSVFGVSLNSQLPSLNEAQKSQHLDCCSLKYTAVLSCQEETCDTAVICLCSRCTNGNISSFKIKDCFNCCRAYRVSKEGSSEDSQQVVGNCSSCCHISETRNENLLQETTNYTLENDVELVYDLIENRDWLEDYSISVDDVSFAGYESGNCLYDSVSLNEFCDSDHSIGLSNLDSSLNNGGSMKALREVIKTSVPSISSLQYLPNRIQSSKVKQENSKTQTTMDSTPKTSNHKPTTSTSSLNESQDSIPHESHLLNSLCLCNCIMKNNSIDNNDESVKKKNNLECDFNDTKCKPNCQSSLSNSSRNTPNQEAPTTKNIENKSSIKSTEKQSPTFLNLLLKSAVELKNGPFSLKQRTVSPCDFNQHQALVDDSSSVLSGTFGEMSASNSGLSGGLKRGQIRSESSLLLSERSASRASAPSDLRQETDARPKSGGSNVDGTQRSVSTRRYLSLNRLFTSNRSSKSGATKDAKKSRESQNISLEGPSENCDNKQKSLFTRSLQRLSYRKRNSKSLQTNASLSSDSSSLSQSPLEYSTDSEPKIRSNDSSLIRSAHSQIITPPEIAINHVEYCDAKKTSRIRSRRTTDSMDLSIGEPESLFEQTHSELYDCNDSTVGGLLISDTDEGSFSLSSTPNYPYDNHLTPNIHARRSPRLSRSPISFESPPTQSSRIEDGLKVCSSEHFEKHIDNIKDTQIEAQKKLFKLWINHYCPNLIRHDLVLEFKDGIKLIGLIASLTRDKQLLSIYSRLNRDGQTYINRIVTTPSSRLRHLANVSIAIEYMTNKLGMKLINLNPMDIVSGKPNVILGLCWNIILKFQLEQNFPCQFPQDMTNVHGADTDPALRRRCSKQDALYCPDEYTPSYFLNAKKKVLDHINKRFNLKLTTLTSNLINGDVLLTILKQLSPEVACMEVIRGHEEQLWDNMSNDDKLDCCFALGQAHLNIPCLFTAADLRKHQLDHNNFKPLLIYLSMLLSANPTTSSSSLPIDFPQPETAPMDINDSLKKYLDDIDSSDKFNLDKLHFTIGKLEKVKDIIQSHKKEAAELELNQDLIYRFNKIQNGVKQVENLISWINEADNLIENTNSSAEDLRDSIDKFRDFFSESNIPHIKESYCPILMRQYRECLSNARQKILFMEQTLKNWSSYQTAHESLKQWLSSAEYKLNVASERTRNASDLELSVDQLSTLMQGLIDYFELEPISDIMNEELSTTNLDSLMNEDTISMTGSVVSLNSNSSKISAFQSSSKATSSRLFEEFEINTRLLATILEPNQREKLLLSMKQFKNTLKYITKIQVPKVVNELRWSIIQLNTNQAVREELDDVANLSEDELLEENVENKCPVEPVEVSKDSRKLLTNVKSLESTERQVDCLRATKSEAIKGKKKPKSVKPRNNNSKKSKNVAVELEKVKTKRPWFFHNWSWLSSYKEPEVETKANKTKPNQAQVKAGRMSKEKEYSHPQLYWSKLVRAYKTSFPFTIVLLVCLAGVCVIPLINKNLCCDFKLDYIPHENLDIGDKPT